MLWDPSFEVGKFDGCADTGNNVFALGVDKVVAVKHVFSGIGVAVKQTPVPDVFPCFRIPSGPRLPRFP